MDIQTLIILAACVSSISFTITFTGLFKGVRELVSKVHPKVEDLFHCPWCFSHWTTFILMFFVWDWMEITGIGFVDFMITAFAITLLSGLCHYVLLRAYEPVGKALVRREIDKLNSNK